MNETNGGLHGFLRMVKVGDQDLAGVESIVQRNTDFGLELYHKLRTAEGNLFFSPYSISTALAMTYTGARGETQVQMARALHFPLEQGPLHPAFAALEARLCDIGSQGRIQLRVANALWPHKAYALLKEFLTLAEQFYGVLITSVDYGDAETARHVINSWVEDRTGAKIRDLIPPGVLNALTRLVLVNAIYFQGGWASQFDESLTHAAPFWVTADDAVRVPMMTQQHEFRYGESDGLQVLELPYVVNPPSDEEE